MRRMLLMAAVLAVTSGCVRKHEPDAAFMEYDGLTLEIDGSRKMELPPELCQLGFSREHRQFRVHNDTMSEYYVLTCSALPENVGQKVRCSLKYASYKMTVFKSGLDFEVIKTDDGGTVWLWNARKRIGITVKMLR